MKNPKRVLPFVLVLCLLSSANCLAAFETIRRTSVSLKAKVIAFSVTVETVVRPFVGR